MGLPEIAGEDDCDAGRQVYHAMRQQLTLHVLMEPAMTFQDGLSGLVAIVSDYIGMLDDDVRAGELDGFCEQVRLRTEGIASHTRQCEGTFLNDPCGRINPNL